MVLKGRTAFLSNRARHAHPVKKGDELELRIKRLREDAIVPAFARKGDAGFDISCSEPVELLPGERKAIPTGLSIAIPSNHVALVMDRSGNALHKGLHCLAGVIDSGYRGEWKVIMVNLGKEKVLLEKGNRIAQALVLPLARFSIAEANELPETERGSKGFGSSGH